MNLVIAISASSAENVSVLFEQEKENLDHQKVETTQHKKHIVFLN